MAEEWSTLVDPEDYFDPVNVSIHGITEADVVNAPTFREVAPTLRRLVSQTVCVSHTHFDRVSLELACEQNNVERFETVWLDSAKVARRTWAECAYRGYGLASVCEKIGYEFRHHDALEDAKACAQVLISASRATGHDIEGWVRRVRQPIDPKSSESVRRNGNPDGPLHGEVMVFTGALQIPRREAVELAASVGCSVASGVTKKTTLLVVGDQDVSRLAGNEKSTKHRKAEELIAAGSPLRILRESDFRELVTRAVENPD